VVGVRVVTSDSIQSSANAEIRSESAGEIPAVSVVLATYNRPELLARLLESLSRQTLAPNRFEVIVVDDGSRVPVIGQIDPSRYAFSLTVLEQPNA
jgi:cellulose synthase/poly-beta-1,6-N-acetylglucosamine synthase-like glycosyltransferase